MPTACQVSFTKMKYFTSYYKKIVFINFPDVHNPGRYLRTCSLYVVKQNLKMVPLLLGSA